MKRIILEELPKKDVYFNAGDRKRFSVHITNWRITMQPHAWHPPTDMIETKSSFIVRVEIAGMQEGDFVISFKDNHLVVNGTRWGVYADCAFHQMEIQNGEFFTSIELPAPIDESAISAVYENGYLNINLPKAKIHKIEIGIKE